MFTPLLAKLPAHPLYSDALSFILTGLFLVLGALVTLSVLIAATGKIFRAREAREIRNRQSRKAPVENPSADLPSSPSPTRVAAPPDDLAAVIAAAVHVALEGQPHRVLHIEPTSTGWAQEGRRGIFSSHRVR